MKRRFIPLMLVTLVLLVLAPIALAQDTPAVERAWRAANQIGRYEFSSTVIAPAARVFWNGAEYSGRSIKYLNRHWSWTAPSYPNKCSI